MITIKNHTAIKKMEEAGIRLSSIFGRVESQIFEGNSTANIDIWIEKQLVEEGLISQMRNYRGYRHVSCISVNHELVHGVPSTKKLIKKGDLVKIDVCAAWDGYCADMARPFFVGAGTPEAARLVKAAQNSLDMGVQQAYVGKRLSDISFAIQTEIEKNGYAVVRDFAGHGIGKRMHEDPEILNYGQPGVGPLLQAGMTFAIEPMLTTNSYKVCVEDDGWTVTSVDGLLTMHVEDTILITENGPKYLTRPS